MAPLDAGGMGEVYRARDTRLRREVAVKVLPREFAGDPERLARFEREANAVAALSHPNILVLHDIGTADGLPYAVMELLEGETVHQRLARGPLPWREAAELAFAIAEGLAAAQGPWPVGKAGEGPGDARGARAPVEGFLHPRRGPGLDPRRPGRSGPGLSPPEPGLRRKVAGHHLFRAGPDARAASRGPEVEALRRRIGVAE